MSCEEEPRGDLGGRDHSVQLPDLTLLAAEDRRIRALRSAKGPVDPWLPLAVLCEEERTVEGTVEPVLTVFLAGSECPFTCVFCDLWRRTLEGPTPPGALPKQLRAALLDYQGAAPEQLGEALAQGEAAAARRIKLYNASNFFDRRAVPPVDDEALCALLAPFSHVTVECHPRLVGRRCFEFAARLDGSLEVAMGLETVHPQALARLNKRMTVGDFDRAAATLAAAGVGLRAFVLVGTPFVPPAEDLEWTVRSVEHALARGAGIVALIPVRGGNGELERLAAAGEFHPPALADLEAALAAAQALGRGVVLADLWDGARLARCALCGPARLARLARMNLTARPEPPVFCSACGGE